MKKMNLFNTITIAARRAASNVCSGARRLALAVVPESVQRRFTDFGNWLTGCVEPTQIPHVLDERAEHVRRNYPPRPLFDIRESAFALREFTRV